MKKSVENRKNGQAPDASETTPAEDPHSRGLKKIMLDAAYAQYPWLLDLDIETIKQLDRLAGSMAEALVRQPV